MANNTLSPFKRPTCRGSYILGSACGHCERCEQERGRMSHDPEPVPEWRSMRPAGALAADPFAVRWIDEAAPVEFSTWATVANAQSDNQRIEQLTAEVLKLRARLDVLERDGNGERG